MQLSPRERPILIFTGLYMAAAAAVTVTVRNTEFIFYLVVMLVLISAVVAVHAHARLSPPVLWGLSLWGAAHMAGGLVPVEDVGVLYNLWLIPSLLKYDQLVHAFGFGVTTWVCWEAIRGSLADRRPRLGPLVLCAAGGMGFGALNEVVEFIAVLSIPNTNVGGYENTGWDLVANLVGVVTAVVLIRVLGGRPGSDSRSDSGAAV